MKSCLKIHIRIQGWIFFSHLTHPHDCRSLYFIIIVIKPRTHVDTYLAIWIRCIFDVLGESCLRFHITNWFWICLDPSARSHHLTQSPYQNGPWNLNHIYLGGVGGVMTKTSHHNPNWIHYLQLITWCHSLSFLSMISFIILFRIQIKVRENCLELA